MLNNCKGRKLLWRVNKGLARDMLPSSPAVEFPIQPWWQVRITSNNLICNLCQATLLQHEFQSK